MNLNDSIIKPVLIKETQSHIKSINDIAFIDDKNLVVTAGADGMCKIFEINTLKLLKTISFRQNLSEKFNYSFRGIKYDPFSCSLFTIQAPLRGPTFLTKWNVRNNFEPEASLKVCDSICTSIDFSPSYEVVGLADCNGLIFYIDASGQMSKIKELSASQTTVKSIAFKDQNLVSGSADNELQLNHIYKRNFISFIGLIKLIILVYIGYYLYTKTRAGV